MTLDEFCSKYNVIKRPYGIRPYPDTVHIFERDFWAKDGARWEVFHLYDYYVSQIIVSGSALILKYRQN